jgi:hypothetical protein
VEKQLTMHVELPVAQTVNGPEETWLADFTARSCRKNWMIWVPGIKTLL